MNSTYPDSGDKTLSGGADLPDSPHDEERMKPEEVTLDLPDVKDIAGQEFVHVPSLGEMADTTISSDDEEGIGLFDDDEQDEDADIMMGTEADVTETEKNILQNTEDDMPGEEELHLREATLDNEDEEGELLNEGSSGTDISGADLDTGGTDEDDPNESIGEEDEENNTYSVGDENER